MALKIEEIMDLSLDDYIALSKKSKNNAVINDNLEKVSHEEIDKGTKFCRRKGNIDDEEDEDEILEQMPKEELEFLTDVEETNTGIWKGPDSSTTYLDCHDSRNDLRQKLNNNSNKNSSSHISALQYRLMSPNNAGNRPRGIPTLLPIDFPINKKSVHNGYRRGNRGNNRNNFQRGFNSGNNKINSNSGGVSNGRVQKNRNQEYECKNMRFSVGGNKYNSANLNDIVNSQTGARNMFIETPSSSINMAGSLPLNSSFHFPKRTASEHCPNSRPQVFPIGNLTPQAEAVLNLNSVGNQQSGSNNESVKSLLGFQGNVSGDVFASRLMEYIQNSLQNPVVHKPVYDMKIQKDIHEIQRKPLLYKCPGGEVVSSDGTGVNCKIIPRTSGVSLNCRFA